MPRKSSAIDSLPVASASALRKLGGDLATGRKRRRQSLRDWAARLNVSTPTLMRMEKGDPSVAIGVYATALWMVNRAQVLGDLADPKEDVAALEMDVSASAKRHQRKPEAPVG
ncbi:MAG: XRE family transcriptional regulator [Ramlibacter sp.]